MMTLDQVWPIVQGSANRPLVAPAITVLAFVAAQRIQCRWPNNPLLNPTLCAIVLVIGYMRVCDVSYASYLANTQVIGFMLGPTIVLLAVPLYRRLFLIKASWKSVAAALIVGLPVGVLSSLAIGVLFGAEPETIYALVPRSVTAGIAMGIEDVLGGIPALTAVFVISTGIFGAAFGPWILRIMRIRDHRVLGMAIGIGGHGIGTARAFQLSEKAGTFASLAMALNGVATAIVIPIAASTMHLHFTQAAVARDMSKTMASPAVDPRASVIARAGSDLWTFLIENQTELLMTVTILLAFASFGALYLVNRILKSGLLIDDRALQKEKVANDTIASLERLVGRQAWALERAASRPGLERLGDEGRLNPNTILFRRPP